MIIIIFLSFITTGVAYYRSRRSDETTVSRRVRTLGLQWDVKGFVQGASLGIETERILLCLSLMSKESFQSNGDIGVLDDNVDRVFSDALLSLSFQERCQVEEEIHGVRNPYPEEKDTPEFVQKALSELDRELAVATSRQGIDPSWIPSNSFFRLRFLRTCCFNVQDTVWRTIKFVSLVRDLCACGRGMQRCACGSLDGGRINISKWFSAKEFSLMRKGHIQLLPYRDRSGRRVLCVLPGMAAVLPPLIRVKSTMYILTEASEDVETQKNGLVMLLLPGFSDGSRDGLRDAISNRGLALKFFLALPLRLSCIHMCGSKTSAFEREKRMLATLLESAFHVRMNFLTGSEQELRYLLLSFGIDGELLPLTDNGGIRVRNFWKWLESLAAFQNVPFGESHKTGDGRIMMECPGVNDVLFSRGKSCRHHPGNQNFRSLLASKKSQHIHASQTGKKLLAIEVMEEVEALNGRFLMWDQSKSLWVEIREEKQIRHKVATHMRDLYGKAKISIKRNDLPRATDVFVNPISKKQKLGQSMGCFEST